MKLENHLKYKALLLDPAWQFKTYNKDKTLAQRSEIQHYKTMALHEIAGMPIPDLADRDCALFMWVTAPHLAQALKLFEMWGFVYKTVAFNWLKIADNQIDMFNPPSAPIRMGHWTRKQSEICLLATRGRPKRLSAGVREVILSPAREHSRKPDEIYKRIEALVAGPYLEVNARQRFPNWDQYGDEIDKFEVGS